MYYKLKTNNMKTKTYVIYDFETVYGVVTASDDVELKSKITTLLDGIREPIEKIDIPPLSRIDDFDLYEFIVLFEDDAEEFNIQRFNVI